LKENRKKKYPDIKTFCESLLIIIH